MNKRVIISVATGDFYMKLQERQINAFIHCVDRVIRYYDDRTADFATDKHYGVDLMLWSNIFPFGSRPHNESPYGFKLHAMRHAHAKGYSSILWLYSPAYPVKKDVSPIFEKIEKEGYYAMSHVDRLENWVGERELKDFNIHREQLVGLNLPSGSCYGFDLNNPIGRVLYNELYKGEQEYRFKDEIIISGGEVVGRHRHDEAILALNMFANGNEVFFNDPLFQSMELECVIRSGINDND